MAVSPNAPVRAADQTRRTNARSALKTRLQAMSGDEPWILAETIKEIAANDAHVRRLLLEAFEGFGVVFPVGYKL